MYRVHRFLPLNKAAEHVLPSLPKHLHPPLSKSGRLLIFGPTIEEELGTWKSGTYTAMLRCENSGKASKS